MKKRIGKKYETAISMGTAFTSRQQVPVRGLKTSGNEVAGYNERLHEELPLDKLRFCGQSAPGWEMSVNRIAVHRNESFQPKQRTNGQGQGNRDREWIR